MYPKAVLRSSGDRVALGPRRSFPATLGMSTGAGIGLLTDSPAGGAGRREKNGLTQGSLDLREVDHRGAGGAQSSGDVTSVVHRAASGARRRQAWQAGGIAPGRGGGWLVGWLVEGWLEDEPEALGGGDVPEPAGAVEAFVAFELGGAG